MSEPSRGVRSVKSAEHSIAVLEFLADRAERPARIREIAEATGIPRSSAYALLQTLADRGWVERDASGLLYGVGLRALIAGVSYLDSDPRVQLVRPHLDRLREDLDETIHMARLDRSDVVYLATRESSQYLRVINRVGRRQPATTTSLGKAILACYSDEERAPHLPATLPAATEHSITDWAEWDADLAATRQRGYAVEREENTAGLHCFGVRLPYDDPPIDAISCSVPVARLTSARESEIVARLQAAVAEISRESRFSRSAHGSRRQERW